MKLFSQAVHIKANLIDTGGLLPQTVLLITPREITDDPHKPLAQDLAFFNCPGLFHFLREKMAGIELTQSRESLSRAAVIRLPPPQLTLECPHIHPDLPAIERKL